MSRQDGSSTLLCGKEKRIEKEMTLCLFVAQVEHCSESFGIVQTWVRQRSCIYKLKATTDICLLALRMPEEAVCWCLG